MDKTPYNKGDEYEDRVVRILAERNLLPKNFHRAGAGAGADAIFIHNGRQFRLEIKKDLQADYGQKMLRWSKRRGWYWSKDDDVTKFFTEMGALKHLNSRGIVPIKFNKSNRDITSSDKTSDQRSFEDKIEIPTEALMRYYKSKRCFYMQIGKKYGFYHLDSDPAKLGTKQFKAKFVLRFRAKTIHSKPVWNYGFYAVLKVDSVKEKSRFNIEDEARQRFPPIEPLK